MLSVQEERIHFVLHHASNVVKDEDGITKKNQSQSAEEWIFFNIFIFIDAGFLFNRFEKHLP